METTKTKTVNGVDVDTLLATLDQLRENPELARFQFRARNKWISGSHNRAMVKDFYGALQEDDSRDVMVFDEDEPPLMLGENKGPNPVEYLLIALSGCLTTALVSHASARGIELKSVDSRYAGDIDVRGFLGISDTVKKQYEAIHGYFRIEADISQSEKEDLLQTAKEFSPVYNSIKDSINVSVQLEP